MEQEKHKVLATARELEDAVGRGGDGQLRREGHTKGTSGEEVSARSNKTREELEARRERPGLCVKPYTQEAPSYSNLGSQTRRLSTHTTP